MSNIEIQCIYYSYAGREATYYNILNKTDFMDETNLTPDGFWFSLGGFSITIDGFKTIFNSHNFYNMVKASTFLLHSLYWLDGKESDWFDKSLNSNEICIEFGMNEKLILRNKNHTEISLSYLNQTAYYERKRGERFFEDFTLNKQAWIDAVKIGLNEYFSILLQVNYNNQSNGINEIQKEYYSVWKQIE